MRSRRGEQGVGPCPIPGTSPAFYEAANVLRGRHWCWSGWEDGGVGAPSQRRLPTLLGQERRSPGRATLYPLFTGEGHT